MTVKIEGLDAIFKKLDGLGKPGVMKRPMNESLEHLHDKIAKYPKETAANRPPGRNGYSWYARGFGTRTRTGRGYATSEDLGPSWTHKTSANGRRGELTNAASYGQFVQDESRQTGFHKRTGWVTIQTVVKKEAAVVLGKFKAAYDKAVK